jgi:predicted deacetylase
VNAARPLVCVVLHDVAPARWTPCRRVLDHLKALAREAGVDLPVSLLVVPAWHGDERVPGDYLQWLRRQSAQGHELVLHGLTHLDEAPTAGWWDRMQRRRLLTAGEGEFAALDAAQAQRKLRAGRQWAARHGLAMTGFVPPAWLLSADSRRALDRAGFDHLCTAHDVTALPQGRSLRVRRMVFSTRTRARRIGSVWWARSAGAVRQGDAVLRLDLHPDDADHADVRITWQRVLASALREREPLLLRDLARRALGSPA